MAAIRDFRLSHSHLIQIVMNKTNIGIEDSNPLVRTWTRILLDIITNIRQQTKPIGKIKEEINFENTHTKNRIDDRKEVQLAKLPYQVRLNNPPVRLGTGRGNGERDPSLPPSHGSGVQHWS